MAYVLKERPSDTIDSVPIGQITEEWLGYIPDRPFSSDEFCRQNRPDDDLELISGMVVQRPMVQWDHEQCQMWLATVMNGYVRARELGVVAGSRTALEINTFQIRLPDLIFIKKENPAEIRQQGVRGIPDLLIEIVSPTDRRGDLIAREADYRNLGAGEILFIALKQQTMKVLRRDEATYTESSLGSGCTWRSESISGLELDVNWVVAEPRPSPFDTVSRLL